MLYTKRISSNLIKKFESAPKLSYENIYNISLGCVKEVIINNKVVDFLQAANVRHKVSPGCSQYQDQGDDEQLQDATENPCQNGRHKCRNGAKCLPKQPTSVANVPYGNQLPPSPADLYECRCTEHFEGKFCENRRKYKFLYLVFADPKIWNMDSRVDNRASLRIICHFRSTSTVSKRQSQEREEK